MSEQRHLTWENFRANYIERADPAVHIIPGHPVIEIFVAPGAARIGMRIQQDQLCEQRLLGFENITTSNVRMPSGLFLELACDKRDLFEPFFAMALEISNLVQLQGHSPDGALRHAADLFRILFQLRSAMTEEAAIGLWGELWLLDQLMTKHGSVALRSWTGPLGEPHDFRLGFAEIEVKTTRATEPVHVIHGLGQLEPSVEKQLYLLSLMVEPSGGGVGTNLLNRIRTIENNLIAEPAVLEEFGHLLAASGYGAESNIPDTSYTLRSLPVLIAVDDSFPRITPGKDQILGGISAAARISNVVYCIHVGGLGFTERDPAFAIVLAGGQVNG